VKKRCEILLNDLNISVYKNICRGLFEKDKLMFSFLISVMIERNAGVIDSRQWSAFLKGPDVSGTEAHNPVSTWLPPDAWKTVVASGAPVNAMRAQLENKKTAAIWEKWYQSFEETALGAPLPAHFASKLTHFQKLMVRSVMRRDRTVFAVKEYVASALGQEFTKPPPFDLESVYKESTADTPIIFVLSPGADPMQYITKLAQDKGREEQLRYISLGQGQGPYAEKLMDNGRRDGDWVVLQNCHLSVSWMPELEKYLDNQSDDVHDEYRLFLTSMPTKSFPVSILQMGMKITNEPPMGIANNLQRTFLDITEEEFEACTRNPRAYKKLLFGLCLFHAIILERRKFGPIGWNIPYGWMNSDLEVSKRQLLQYVEENDHIPYKTLRELIGEVNYAGRVTDDNDQICVGSML